LTTIPIRMCIGCHRRKPKAQLLRIVKEVGGNIYIDDSFKKPGRGTYMCKDVDCLSTVRKKKNLERYLKSNVSDEFYHYLLTKIQQDLHY